MNSSQALMDQIAALRQPTAEADEAGRVRQVESRIDAGFRRDFLLNDSLRQLADPTAPRKEAALPTQLTCRARRILEQGRQLIGGLRTIGGQLAEFASQEANDETEPLVRFYQETVAMADASLRMVQAFPDAPSAQLRLCEGLTAIVANVAERAVSLQNVVDQRRREAERVNALADLLLELEAGKPMNGKPFISLAEALLADAQQAAPLRFYVSEVRGQGSGVRSQESGVREQLDSQSSILDPPASSLQPPASSPQPVIRLRASAEVARFVASHSLVVAQVMARLARHDPELRGRPGDAVLAALLHDVGMLRIPAEILAHPGLLDDAQRRVVESHARIGADLAARLFPEASWLSEAAAGHHERLDGTGYPTGLRELQISPLVRLLAVGDVYAALCANRPYRPAKDTRAALTDVLLLAEGGTLDRSCAERLLTLSFYPVGSVVELADGALGVVVATHSGRRDPNTPASPVLALLTDSQRRPLPSLRHLDLNECSGRSIVRALSLEEQRAMLEQRPRWCSWI